VQREGVRDAARRTLTSEIAVRAVELFVRQGFEETTVDQIAAEVGMSTRSLFRYFASKEDMIVGDLVEVGYAVAAALRDRPPSEVPWVAMRQALQVCVDSLESSGLQRAIMLATTPTLRIAMIKNISGGRNSWSRAWPNA
jgi:AcrR family transcriptional regulator